MAVNTVPFDVIFDAGFLGGLVTAFTSSSVQVDTEDVGRWTEFFIPAIYA